MTSRSTLRQFVVAAAMSALATGCADLERGPAACPRPGHDAGASDGVVVSYASEVAPVLATCRRCHVPGQEAGDSALLLAGDAEKDYAALLPFVDTAAPAASRLLAKIAGQGHGGGTIYPVAAPEYQTVLQWIQQGARP
jgi:hypothetical protein